MDWKQIVGGFVLLIAIYLLVQNATNTNQVLTGLSGAVTNETAALQGRSSTAAGSISTIVVPTG